MKLSQYQESITLQKDGAPIAIGSATFYIRRSGTKESKKLVRDLQMQIFGPFHRMQEEDDLLLRAHWLVEYGCASWHGLFNEDDSPLPYSQDAARKVFLNPEYHLSLNAVLWMAAHNFENYLHEQAEEDLEQIKKVASDFKGSDLESDYKAAAELDKRLGTKNAQKVLEQINAVQLTSSQQMLLSRFYDGLREAKPECRIDYATLERLAYTVIYEQDLAVSIWQRLDDYLVKLRNDKLKADLDKQRLKR